jgi:hypothetical protein
MDENLVGMDAIQADATLSDEVKRVAVDAASYDTVEGVAAILADDTLKDYGDDLLERIVQRLVANGAAEADARAGAYSWWLF